MKHPATLLCIIGLAACDPPPANDTVPAEPPGQAPAESAVAPEPSDAPKATARVRWEASVSGDGVELPTTSGFSVMGKASPDGATYRSLGAPAMFSLKLKEPELDKPGTYPAAEFSVGFLKQKWTCGYSELATDGGEFQLIITEADGAKRGEFAGDVLCAPNDDPQARKKAKVKGWFER